MPRLIQNTAQLEAQLGAAYSVSHDIDQIAPFLDLARDEYISKAISPELVDALEAVSSWPSSDAHLNKLRDLVCRALAFYGYYLYINGFATGRDGDNGLQETNSDRVRPIRQAMLNMRIDATLDSASKSLEYTLQYLYNNAAHFTAFTASSTYQSAIELYIQTGEMLGLACPPTDGFYRVLFTLKPYMAEVQRRVFLTLLGNDLHTRLIAGMKASDLTEAEKNLLSYVRRALAYRTYYEALPHLNIVQNVRGGIRVLSEFDGINNKKAVQGDDFLNYRRDIKTMSDSYERELKNFLEANKSTYPLYVPDPNYQDRRNPIITEDKRYKRLR